MREIYIAIFALITLLMLVVLGVSLVLGEWLAVIPSGLCAALAARDALEASICWWD